MSWKAAEDAQTKSTEEPFLGKGQTEGLGHDAQGPPMPAQTVIVAPPQYTQYGQPVYYSPQPGGVVMANRPAPYNYLPQAIMVTMCCFFPTGIIAIMRASDARAAANYGDMESAYRHAKDARKMVIVSLLIGIVCTLICIAFFVYLYIWIFSNAK